MSYIEIFILIINLLTCLPSLASTTKFDYWWVRDCDFPRIQISILTSINIIGALYIYSFTEWYHFGILILLCICLVYQCWLILPYTFLWKKQVLKYDGKKK